MEDVDRRIDSTWTSGSGTGSHLVTDKSWGAWYIDALVENGGVDTTSFYFVCYEESGDTFENATGCGNWSQNYFKRYYFKGGGLPPSVDIQVKGYDGYLHLGSGYTGFEFHYPNKPTDVAIVAQAGGIAQGTSLSKYTVCCPEYHWEESSNNTPTGSSVYTEFNANECTITKSGASYTVTGSRVKVTYSGEQKTTRTVVLDATISLFDSPTGVEQMKSDLPTSFNLQQNYPNPFNPTTTISFSLPSKSFVSLKLFDVLGREILTLVNEELSIGNYIRKWNATNVSSGIYFYRLQAGSFIEIKKLVLLR